MLLNKVIIHDFRVFHGENVIELDIDPANDRNIILIGGLNGSGKTSILDAIKLALYGEKAQLSKGESYRKFLSDNFNETSWNEGKREFYIELIFTREDFSLESVSIKRKWKLTTDNFEEEIEIQENGQAFNDNNKEEYIETIVPLGVSQFFFFDGEKIQSIADENDYQNTLIDAIKDILNIKIYDTLCVDLKSYEDNIRRNEKQAQRSDVISLQEEIEKLKEQKNHINEELEDKIQEKEKCISERKSIEKWIRQNGSDPANLRINIEEQLLEIKEKRNELENKLLEFLEELPSYILRQRFSELFEQINKEQQFRERNSLLKKKYNKLINCINDINTKPPLTEEQRSIIKKRIKEVFADLFDYSDDEIKIIHDLSASEVITFRSQMKPNTKLISSIDEIIKESDFLSREKFKLEKQKRNIPTDPRFEENETRRNDLLKEEGSLTQQIKDIRRRIEEIDELITTYEHKYENLLDKVEFSELINKKVRHSRTIRRTLEEFINILSKEKALEVQTYLTEMFIQLIRKKEIVKAFHIDPQSFIVTFESTISERLKIRSLSAGEKEIYAIALVWALARAAQRPLPMVIDTPFGRLDQEHRRNMVTQFFPNANRQVIILSTDTEVVGDWKKTIERNIAKEYLCLYDKQKKHTKIKQGYFDNMEVNNA